MPQAKTTASVHRDSLGQTHAVFFPRLCDCLGYVDAKALRASSRAAARIVRATPDNKWRIRWDIERERAVLLASFAAGKKRTSPLALWGRPGSVGGWQGVMTDGVGLVRELQLRGKKLSGAANLLRENVAMSCCQRSSQDVPL